MVAQLLTPPKVVVRQYFNLSHAEMTKLINTRKRRKLQFSEVAYLVAELPMNRYDVQLEYIVKNR